MNGVSIHPWNHGRINDLSWTLSTTVYIHICKLMFINISSNNPSLYSPKYILSIDSKCSECTPYCLVIRVICFKYTNVQIRNSTVYMVNNCSSISSIFGYELLEIMFLEELEELWWFRGVLTDINIKITHDDAAFCTHVVIMEKMFQNRYNVLEPGMRWCIYSRNGQVKSNVWRCDSTNKSFYAFSVHTGCMIINTSFTVAGHSMVRSPRRDGRLVKANYFLQSIKLCVTSLIGSFKSGFWAKQHMLDWIGFV